MDWAIERLPAHGIDLTDTTYRVTTGGCDAALVRSVEHLGVLHPPIVVGSPSGWRVVSGFRRIEACRVAGIREVTALRLSDEVPPGVCAEIAIAANSFQRSLNTIEQARAARLLVRHTRSEEMLAAAAERAGIPGSVPHLQRIARLCDLIRPVRDGLATGAIALPVAEVLGHLEEKDSRPLAETLNRFPMSLNRQRELVELVVEIGRREGVAPSSVLDAAALGPPREDGPPDPKGKAREILEMLRRRRYPEISAAESRFRGHVRALGLPENLTLTPPRGFESPVYTLQIRFQTPADLENSSAAVRAMAGHADLNALLSIGETGDP